MSNDLQQCMDMWIMNLPLLPLPDRSYLRMVVDRDPNEVQIRYAFERAGRFAASHPAKPEDEVARILLDILRKKMRKDAGMEVS